MVTESENSLVKRATNFAELSLAGKQRFSGEEFLEHCLKVARILKRFAVNDPTTLAVAILHHSISHGAATEEDLRKEFGEEISSMVKSLDGLRVIKVVGSDEKQFAENLRKMFLALARDLRVVLIKLCDIYDNLQTLDYLPKDKQIENARETLEVFAPLAERLGIGELKGEMQDLAFKYLYPEDFIRVTKMLSSFRESLEETESQIRQSLEKALQREGIGFRVESRIKHLYSLFMKLKRPEIDFDLSKVYDLVAFRVIVADTEDCYKTLGIVHKLWQPMPGKISDFIAHPKPNGYQSIHARIIGPDNHPFEIQIRSEKMHEQAEYGVAAHWHYAEKKAEGASDEKLTVGVSADVQKLDWVKRLSSWQEEVLDNEEFLESVKTEFFGQRVFVFTPKGDVKDLPSGASPVDFAYAVHTGLGSLTMGARVNGKMVPLNTKLKNGDVCEIILSKDKTKKPNRDWLSFVVTATARKKIKKALSNL